VEEEERRGEIEGRERKEGRRREWEDLPESHSAFRGWMRVRVVGGRIFAVDSREEVV
jgi:hypothetical protein